MSGFEFKSQKNLLGRFFEESKTQRRRCREGEGGGPYWVLRGGSWERVLPLSFPQTKTLRNQCVIEHLGRNTSQNKGGSEFADGHVFIFHFSIFLILSFLSFPFVVHFFQFSSCVVNFPLFLKQNGKLIHVFGFALFILFHFSCFLKVISHSNDSESRVVVGHKTRSKAMQWNHVDLVWKTTTRH